MDLTCLPHKILCMRGFHSYENQVVNIYFIATLSFLILLFI